MSGKCRARKVLLRYCDGTELLLGPIRTPVDEAQATASTPTSGAAGGEGF